MVEVGVVEPDDPFEVLLQATTMKAATNRHTRVRIAFQLGGKRLARFAAVIVSSGKDFWFAGDGTPNQNGKDN
jgi:hypothetical protein